MNMNVGLVLANGLIEYEYGPYSYSFIPFGALDVGEANVGGADEGRSRQQDK
jgi:hypothetical protein